MRIFGAVAGLLAVPLSVGCSHSDLRVPPEDRVFGASLARLERTANAVNAEVPPGAEASLFMMGEALYRYRLEFPTRNMGVYLAQAAAVAIELPALQSIAGSLDLFQLRLKTTDGAVQIWETFLARFPESRLRPLALYRLGWAYRNTLAGGFPRASGDEAFAELLRAYPRSTAAAFAADALRVPWKSADAATAWSIIPGAGQMYVGEYTNGAVRLGAALVATAMIVVPGIIGYGRREDASWGRDWPLVATAVGGIVLLSVNYSLAYEDAIRGVIEFNERQQARFEAQRPEAP